MIDEDEVVRLFSEANPVRPGTDLGDFTDTTALDSLIERRMPVIDLERDVSERDGRAIAPRRRRIALAAAVVAFVAVGVVALVIALSGSDDTEVGVASDGPVCSPGRPFEAGHYERVNVRDGVEQPYTVIVPASYSGVRGSPVMVMLPGKGGQRDQAVAGFGPYVPDGLGLVVIPDQTAFEFQSPEMTESLLSEVATEFCVDTAQIAVFGVSSATWVVARTVSALPERFAFAVVGLGSFSPQDPVGTVPILAWTGDLDRALTLNSVDQWARFNGCQDESTTTDLGSGVRHVVFDACDAPVELYDIEGMGHQYPLEDCDVDADLGTYEGLCAQYDELDVFDAAIAFREAISQS